MFSEAFSIVDKQAQREGTGKPCVFVDSFRGDGDVKEGDEEKRMGMISWRTRRIKLDRRNFLF